MLTAKEARRLTDAKNWFEKSLEYVKDRAELGDSEARFTLGLKEAHKFPGLKTKYEDLGYKVRTDKCWTNDAIAFILSW